MNSVLHTCREHWDRFFYRSADPRIYAGIRIGFGVLLLLNALVLGLDWIKWFGDEGVLDVASGRQIIDQDTWSLFFWLPATATVLWVCYAVFLSQILALIAGLASRVQAVCLFVWLLSLHHRNNLIWDGEDVLFRLTCFLLIWMPLGKVWSVDAILGKRNVVAQSSPAWPVRLLQIQLSCLYLSTVLSKLSGPAWRDGTALYYVAKLDEFFGRLPMLEGVFEILWLVRILTWLTISIELLLVFGVWIPSIRIPTVILGLLFHLGIELAMNLFLFQWLMMLILSTHLGFMDQVDRYQWKHRIRSIRARFRPSKAIS